jgi:hypothetical protein
MTYCFIREHTCEFTVEEMCEVLEVSRSGYYRWRVRKKSKREEENEWLLKYIKLIFESSRKTYGSPSIKNELFDNAAERYIRQDKEKVQGNDKFPAQQACG